MKEEYSSKEYLDFLDNFANVFKNRIDELVESKILEDDKYQSIFENYSKDNKEIFEDLLNKLFDLGIDFSEMQRLLDMGIIAKKGFDKIINKKMLDIVNGRRVYYEKTDDMYFYGSKFMNVLEFLTDFFRNNYFTLENNTIIPRDLKVEPEECREVAGNLSPRTKNFDAIMDKNGDIFMAIGYHDLLIEYLLANSIDMRESVRISQNQSNGTGFDLSSLYAFYDYYTTPEDIEKDRFVYLNKKRIRNLCRYLKSAMPNLSKNDLCNVFERADGFGYDFTSTSSENDTDLDYDIAMENLKNIAVVLDEMYPDDPSIDLPRIYSNRLRDLSHNIF